ncbi:unnamed protein product [Linum tenue]|uniref:Uncharacterized protein n=1 Tax=Linum tenue TaxID=586396 RepID=A0AAV0JWX1_9ROSI|nr:unnamed protein product [Linum tenue]
MGLEMELEFKKKSSTSDLSPNTVLPLRQCSESDSKTAHHQNLTRKDHFLRVKEGFTEISFRRYRSTSCKNVQSSRPSGVLAPSVDLKRGSMYQSSRDVMRMKKMESSSYNEGRRKIELSRGSHTSFSLDVVESLCSSDEEDAQKVHPASALEAKTNLISGQKPCLDPPCPSADAFIEICPNLVVRERRDAGTVGRSHLRSETQGLRSENVAGPQNDANSLLERDVPTFHKTLSAKLEMPHSPSSASESDCSTRGSSKSRFVPIRKMFDPFMKSKSLRSPLSNAPYPSDHPKANGTVAAMRRNELLRKSLLHDFSHTSQQNHHSSNVASSAVHLHGSLKLKNKNKVPYFEFSLSSPEEVLVAKTWKVNNASKWVYTFHSVCNRKRSNASGRGGADESKESMVVAGQMHVSSYLHSEVQDCPLSDNSMVTEFVLYDIAHARNSVSSEGSPDVNKSSSNGSFPCLDGGMHHDTDDGSATPSHSSSPHNMSVGLQPDLEIAAIVIQIPFAKRESLKYKRGYNSRKKVHLNLLNLSMAERSAKQSPDRESTEKVKVVIPMGNHSLPSDAESQGPCSLLDRWRSGGGCDCGGWDMACPLNVFGNPDIQCGEDEPLVDSQKPLELFIQGTKEKTPALMMRVVEEGEYAVDFHAKLSTLQAFSICVAMLHGSEAASAVGDSRRKKKPMLPHCNSLKVLIEEEVKFLIDAVTEEEKKKPCKKLEKKQQSYKLKPPISPFSRV